ncbi:hypothetical protein FWP33_08860 [Vibrio parahaemolyticus]|uniref:Thioredoxin domain-containing protein n=1 Tax=Vibrio jasicida TaxID=766224 RepID=A0AAU9QT86_9VIBR|nr:hypothetical protein [Vibrio parahaemolyticus]ELA8176691.1 hypothetical protein [Vibrio alginolyticus]CAH1598765.1 hypothetical protein THF1C08_50235 [Vibrio jasicida]EJC7176130.1 hypothetical protein [Vibrio parahaemolyticus]EJE4724569.1 hypothetical protein [Vibrio parahaemolyticus]
MSKSRPRMSTKNFILTTIIDVAVFLVGYYALFWHPIINWKLFAGAVVTFLFNRFLIKTFIEAANRVNENDEYAQPTAPLPLNEGHQIQEIVSSRYSTSRPTIFLAIHGVLHRNQNESLELKQTFMEIFQAVPNVQIVLSSDWRSDCDEPWLKRKLGIDLFSKIVGYTPVSLEHDRSFEIERVLQYKNPIKFVILDAEKVTTDRPNGLVIRTEGYKGIEQKHIDAIIDYLK